jgi:hypothetical protein
MMRSWLTCAKPAERNSSDHSSAESKGHHWLSNQYRSDFTTNAEPVRLSQQRLATVTTHCESSFKEGPPHSVSRPKTAGYGHNLLGTTCQCAFFIERPTTLPEKRQLSVGPVSPPWASA